MQVIGLGFRTLGSSVGVPVGLGFRIQRLGIGEQGRGVSNLEFRSSHPFRGNCVEYPLMVFLDINAHSNALQTATQEKYLQAFGSDGSALNLIVPVK